MFNRGKHVAYSATLGFRDAPRQYQIARAAIGTSVENDRVSLLSSFRTRDQPAGQGVIAPEQDFSRGRRSWWNVWNTIA